MKPYIWHSHVATLGSIAPYTPPRPNIQSCRPKSKVLSLCLCLCLKSQVPSLKSQWNFGAVAVN